MDETHIYRIADAAMDKGISYEQQELLISRTKKYMYDENIRPDQAVSFAYRALNFIDMFEGDIIAENKTDAIEKMNHCRNTRQKEFTETLSKLNLESWYSTKRSYYSVNFPRIVTKENLPKWMFSGNSFIAIPKNEWMPLACATYAGEPVIRSSKQDRSVHSAFRFAELYYRDYGKMILSAPFIGPGGHTFVADDHATLDNMSFKDFSIIMAGWHRIAEETRDSFGILPLTHNTTGGFSNHHPNRAIDYAEHNDDVWRVNKNGLLFKNKRLVGAVMAHNEAYNLMYDHVYGWSYISTEEQQILGQTHNFVCVMQDGIDSPYSVMRSWRLMNSYFDNNNVLETEYELPLIKVPDIMTFLTGRKVNFNYINQN